MKASIKPVLLPTLLWMVILPGVGHSATIFVRATQEGVPAFISGDGSRNSPYNTLLVEDLGNGKGVGDPHDTILVLRSDYSLDGGVTLQDHQHLQGFNQSVCQNEPFFSCDLASPASVITNSTAHNEGAGIILANQNRVSWLVVKDVPAGHGILGDNVTGTRIDHVLVSDVNSSLQTDPSTDPVTGSRCSLLAVPQTVRGCWFAVFFGQRVPFGGILFLADDSGYFPVIASEPTSKNAIRNASIRNVTGGFGVGLQVAGSVRSQLTIENAMVEEVKGGNPGASNAPTPILALAYEQSAAELLVRNTYVDNSTLDGVIGATGFLFSGGFVPSAFNIPVSDATMIMNVDGFVYRNTDGSAARVTDGVEIVAVDPFLTNTLELHVQNSDIQDAPNTGILFNGNQFPPFGPARVAIFDAGCIEDCPPGFTSVGNNILQGNRSPFSPGLEVIATGAFAAKAEGNWWGDPLGPGECFNLDLQPPPVPLDTRCLERRGGSLDVEPHLTEKPW